MAQNDTEGTEEEDSMTKINGGSAFPLQGSMGGVEHRGMSLRDYFAAAALQGTLAACAATIGNPDDLAARSYKFADAMLAERAK